jgi:hypothetical protein
LTLESRYGWFWTCYILQSETVKNHCPYSVDLSFVSWRNWTKATSSCPCSKRAQWRLFWQSGLYHIAGIVGRHDWGHPHPNTYPDLDHVENWLGQGGKWATVDDHRPLSN